MAVEAEVGVVVEEGVKDLHVGGGDGVVHGAVVVGDRLRPYDDHPAVRLRHLGERGEEWVRGG